MCCELFLCCCVYGILNCYAFQSFVSSPAVKMCVGVHSHNFFQKFIWNIYFLFYKYCLTHFNNNRYFERETIEVFCCFFFIDSFWWEDQAIALNRISFDSSFLCVLHYYLNVECEFNRKWMIGFDNKVWIVLPTCIINV